jgi:fatty-acyl-CoA synthase
MTGHLAELTPFWGRRLPDRGAVRFPGLDVSWSRLDAAVDELACGLHAAGVGPGAMVGILMSNRFEFVETMLAVFRVGGTVALLNTRLTPSEMAYPVRDSGARLIVTEPALAPLLTAALAASALGAGAPDAGTHPRVLSVDPAPGCGLLDELRVAGGRPPDRDSDPEEIALLAYTSGTTGVPKGAMLSHRAIVANGQARAMADGLTWRDRVLCLMPLAFTGGASTFLREVICTGASAVVESTFDPPRVLELLETEKITACSAVPVMWERLLALPAFADADLSALRAGVAGGATMPVEVIRAWQARGVGMRQGYGQTEFAGGYATLLYEDEAVDRVGFVGRPVLNTQVRVVDERDRDVPTGEAGQILLRGPSVMSGYWNKPVETAEALSGGWLHTGDIGVLDRDGYLRVVDRARDMLISGGFNVYPAELEKVLAGLPGLEECAVIGVPDARWGEVPMLVVPAMDGIDLAGLRVVIRERLADYRRPRWLAAHGGDLPRTLGGKILKRELRAGYPEVPAGAVSLRPDSA